MFVIAPTKCPRCKAPMSGSFPIRRYFTCNSVWHPLGMEYACLVKAPKQALLQPKTDQNT